MPKPSVLAPRSLAVVAVLALVLGAFGATGSSYAAGVTAKQVKKIAAKVVKKQASKLSVAHATTATTATTAGNSAKLGGADPAAYLDRFAHENLTSSVDLTGGLVTQVMNPTVVDVPAGVGFIHVTAVASFDGAAADVEVWPSLDGPCAAAGPGYAHRSLGNTTQQTSVAVDFVAPVTPGEHAVRLCAGPSAGTTIVNRSLTIETVAGDFNG